MVVAEDIVELGFMPYKIKRGDSIFYVTYEEDVVEIIINLNTGRYRIKFNEEEISKGKVSSIEQLEDKLQEVNGEH